MKKDMLHPPALDIDKILHKPDGRPHANGVLERRIVWNLIAQVEAAGFPIRYVEDEDEVTGRKEVKTAKEAMELIFNLDEVHIYFQKGKVTHWVFLVLGNGTDIVSDFGMPRKPDAFSKILDTFDGEDFA